MAANSKTPPDSDSEKAFTANLVVKEVSAILGTGIALATKLDDNEVTKTEAEHTSIGSLNATEVSTTMGVG